ncbi:hypothetical protein MATR_09820 [Marivirga tractuosa]|uniref:Uncharacterized protein n=1 Tax=Marivirga tractuosa (strain ATCC 23168 / DSM 4126 / NBRC 15989 / NCIMB 1408 / VKM B-1430 / H-43) TaxID=643867 RepID=E4TMV8_MARTH|nr:hypothetical protein [Marivirga tractuosa]ADR21389.1 hypothetical protein Ftrac_1399 [Marivirga tractuosa DSM 4126]BDD14157.1 hypothetical protein MATR_09820 [Marivirga tractuosa]
MYKIENGDFGNLIPVTSEEHRIIVMVREKLIEHGIPVHELYQYAFDHKKQKQLKRLGYKKDKVKEIRQAALNTFLIEQTEKVHLYIIKSNVVTQLSTEEFITGIIKSEADTVFFEIVNGQIELAKSNNFNLINIDLQVPPSFQNIYDLIESGVNVSLVTTESETFRPLITEFRDSSEGKLTRKMFTDFSEIEVEMNPVRKEGTVYSRDDFDSDGEMLMNVIASQYDLKTNQESIRKEVEKLDRSEGYLTRFIGISFLLHNLDEVNDLSNMLVHHLYIYHLAVYEVLNPKNDIPDEVIVEIEKLKQGINFTNNEMIEALRDILAYSVSDKIGDTYNKMNFFMLLQTEISISEKSEEELQSNILLLDKLETDIEKLVGTIVLFNYYDMYNPEGYDYIEGLYYAALDEIGDYIHGELDLDKIGHLMQYVDDENGEDLGDVLMELQDDLIEKLMYFKHRQLFEVRI